MMLPGDERKPPMEQRLAKVETRVDSMEAWCLKHDKDQREDFESFRDELKEALRRPQAWVTALIAVLSGTIGILAGALWS